jgi:TonB family protein
MNTPENPSPGWPRHRWFLVLLIAFASHLWLIFYFSEDEAQPPSREVDTRIAFSGGFQQEMESEAFFALSDPALFALANPFGFSGAAWLRLREIPYPVTNWNEAPRWLQTGGASLAADFLDMVSASGAPMLAALEKPPPTVARMETPIAAWTPRTGIRLLDGLAGWRLASPGPLPVHEEISLVKSTVLRLLVRSSGEVHSAVLEQSSGSKTADLNALEFVRGARFHPPEDMVPPREDYIHFGRVVIDWFGRGSEE